jgi:hypothetical protein
LMGSLFGFWGILLAAPMTATRVILVERIYVGWNRCCLSFPCFTEETLDDAVLPCKPPHRRGEDAKHRRAHNQPY